MVWDGTVLLFELPWRLWLEEDLSDNAGPGLGLRGNCGVGLGDEDELHELLAPE
jgi:hypothetical protein